MPLDSSAISSFKTKTDVDTILDRKSYSANSASSNSLSLSVLINQFLQYCEVEKNLSPGTVKMYHFYLKELLGWFRQSLSKDVVSYRDLTLQAVSDFRVYLNRRQSTKSRNSLKKNTQNRYLTALRSFLRYCEVVKELESQVLPDKVILSKPEPRIPKFLNSDEVDDLVKTQDLSKKSGIRDRAILEFLFSTGMRISELVNLNRIDISPQILEKHEFAIIGKGRKVRTVYISNTSAKWLKQYLSTRKDNFVPLFVRYSGKSMDENDPKGESLRLTPRSIQRMVKKYAHMAGLSVDVTPHVLRHSFATDLLMAGADLRSVQELLGHSDVSTTQIYTHVTNKHLKEVHEKFHKR